MRYAIYFFGKQAGRPDFQLALSCALDCLIDRFLETGNYAECFAIIYDKLNQIRWLSWLDEGCVMKYRKIN